ncbi:MAG: acyl carrier protein [Ignavibacteria bacterium]|nr:acyl carrier protein [Ignavibacteria bacterium]
MQTDQIYSQLNDVFKEVFNKNDLEINDDTSADQIEEWDSLQHLILMITVEKKFGIKFTAKETQLFNNVGEMVKAIKSKLD